jgi:hypothetical protein
MSHFVQRLALGYGPWLCLHHVVGTGVFVVGFVLCVCVLCVLLLRVLCVCVLCVLWRVFGQAVPAALTGIPPVMRVAAGTHGSGSGVITNSLTYPG